MRRAEIFMTVVSAVVLGAIIAVIPNADQRLSVDLWLVVVAAWAGLSLTRRALGVIPIERDRLRLALRFHPDPAEAEPSLPRDLLALEGSLLAAADNGRSYDYRLRPRLRRVTAHRLRLNRGIDLDREPARAEAVLGQAASLIDENAAIGHDGRAPSPEELARLLDRSEPDR